MKNTNKIVSLPSIKDAAKRNNNINYQYDSVVFPDAIKDYGKNKYYFIRTYGCQGNLRDSEVIAGILEKMGYTVTEDEQIADIILLNTCCVRENAEKKVFGEIGTLKSLKKQKEDLIIGVCGCMVQQEHIVETLLSKYNQVNLIFGTHNIYRLPTLISQIVETHQGVCEVFSDRNDIQEDLPSCR